MSGEPVQKEILYIEYITVSKMTFTWVVVLSW